MADEEKAPDEDTSEDKEEAGDETPAAPSKYKEEVKPEANTLVNRALEAADNLNKASERMEKATIAAREIQAVNIISGKAEAGTEAPKEKTEEEKVQEESDNIVKMFR